MNRIKGSAIWQTNKNDVQTHKSQRFPVSWDSIMNRMNTILSVCAICPKPE